MRTALLALVLWGAPDVKLPPKQDVIPSVSPSRPALAAAVLAGVRAARSSLERCHRGDAGADCVCAALKKVRFDVALDGGTLVVSYPLQGHTGTAFTIDRAGKVTDCRP